MSGTHPRAPRDRRARPTRTAARTATASDRAARSEHPLRIHTFLTGSGLLVVSLVGGWLIAVL